MKRLLMPLVCVFAFVALAVSSASAGSDTDAIALKVVPLAELKSAIKEANKGKVTGEVKQQKVVVVYFWASYNIPCMREFDTLMKLHRKYQDKGVVCVSVSLDRLERKRIAYQFLKRKNAAIANFLLDDDEGKWQDEWNIGAIPAVMVYETAGKLHPFTSSSEKQFTYADVEKLVQKLIAK